MGTLLSRDWVVEDTDLDGVYPRTEPETAAQRHIVDVSTWRPTRGEWLYLMSLLSPDESAAVERIRLTIDRKRAMVSRLLQRRSVSEGLRVPYAGVFIRRTKGGKPFEGGSVKRAPKLANFNFNVAHEGHFVVLASDPALLVGIDISAPFEIREGKHIGSTIEELRRSFEHSFTDDEWETMGSAPTEVERVRAFRAQWSLKEAFVKARGDGLAFELRRVEFCFCRPPEPSQSFKVDCMDFKVDCMDAIRTEKAEHYREWSKGHHLEPLSTKWARVYLDGELLPDWRCSLSELPRGHLVSIARGPVEQVQDEIGDFRRTLGYGEIPACEFRRRLAAPPPPFTLLSVRDLLPQELVEQYRENVGDFVPNADGAAPPMVRARSCNSALSKRASRPGLRRSSSFSGEPPCEMPKWMNPKNYGSIEAHEADACVIC